MQYAKALVAIAGAAITAALGIIPANTTTWQLLTIAAALVTALGVYLVPNQPAKAAAKPAVRHPTTKAPATKP
jgi:peptidoglycan/LPS O-acetylase OafA/YrhL